jgi:hypothetical protein
MSIQDYPKAGIMSRFRTDDRLLDAKLVTVDLPMIRGENWSVRVTPRGHRIPAVAYGFRDYRLGVRLTEAINAGVAFHDNDPHKPLFNMTTLARDLDRLGY